MEKIMTSAISHYLNLMVKVSPETAGRHGFNIFCYPVRPPLKPHHKEFFQTAEKFSFLYNNVNIQGYKWGNGPKKHLFIHGWKSHSFQWKNYIKALSEEEYTIYAIDAPGHGNSDGKFLNVPYYSNVISEVIDIIGSIDTVVSHSLGSFSILHLLHTKPNVPISRLVLMAPPGNATDFFEFYRTTLKLSDRTVRVILDYFERVIQKPIGYFSTESFASNISKPGLIIHDKFDKETPYENALLIHQAWKNSQLITTEGLNHNLKSPEVVKTIIDYILEYDLVKSVK